MTVWASTAANQNGAVVFSRVGDNDVGELIVGVEVPGGAESPVDLSGATLTAQLQSMLGEVWLEWTPLIDAGGVLIYGPHAGALSDPVWRGRATGRLIVTAVHDGRTDVLVRRDVVFED